ncbi:hypothetical protein NDU88_006575 [Pleurodeles waltl]|uniref:Uncharacterized protein n=1 Tax=Pleurodeles waltl TaxID=8319 RepID=A0AAV7WDX1_PLEWA|nr:hypothetical protein NDU88_006575 [Pleurodeles waltl]
MKGPTTTLMLDYFTDTAGSAAIMGTSWCAAQWPGEWHQKRWTRSTTLLELFSIVVVFLLWGERLANKQVTLWSDNHAVVQVLTLGLVQCPRVLGLLRYLVDCQLAANIAIGSGTCLVAITQLLIPLSVDKFPSASTSSGTSDDIFPRGNVELTDPTSLH